MIRKRVRELEAENAQFKRMYADLTLENTAVREDIEKKLWRRRLPRQCDSSKAEYREETVS